MFGGKTVRRTPKNAVTKSNDRSNRGVSSKAPRGKQAPKEATKRKRRGPKYGGSKRERNQYVKKENPGEKNHGVLYTEDEYQKMAEEVIVKINENNLETPSEVAAVLKDEFLKGKPHKEKAATLNGLVRHLGKHPRRYATYAIIIVIAIFYLFKFLGLDAYITSPAKSVWNFFFLENPDDSITISEHFAVAVVKFVELRRHVVNLTVTQSYGELAKLVASNKEAAQMLIMQEEQGDAQSSEHAKTAIKQIEHYLNLNVREKLREAREKLKKEPGNYNLKFVNGHQ